MKRLFVSLAVTVCVVATSGSSQLPFHGKSGENLRDAVAAVCRPSRLIVGAQRWFTAELTDEAGMLQLPFDGVMVNASPLWPDDVMQIEIVPTTWWQFDTEYFLSRGDTLRCDLVNLYPVVVGFSEAKASYPPGNVERVKWSGGVWKAGFLTIDGVETNVWEPPENMKGDVARVLMYMATVYPTVRWDPWAFLLLKENNNWPAFTSYGISMLMDWSRNDPVDDVERQRNEKIIAAQGGYGNPFVMWPDLDEYLWGRKAGEVFLDPDAAPDERLPLRSVYHLTDARIDLWTPLVSEAAVWSIDGRRVGESVAPSELGVGRHTFSYSVSNGECGQVIITVEP